MKKVIVIAALLAIVLTALVLLSGKKINGKTMAINGQKIVVEVADNDTTRTQGLSGRLNLAKDHGMLFVYPSSSYYYFWVKEMKFPLDFIWIDKDKIVDLTENVPIPQTNDISKLPVFTSKYPADKILEINAGMIKSLNVKIGDKIQF